ncbi:MAG TPA: hypothetical protein VKA70_15235 [Blastocatellia bacterium]|nr:hypothetical protein [Blastocatellia bacterium]
MRKFKYSLLVALGFLIFATTQYAFSPQDRGMGVRTQREWGSGPASGGTGVEGVDPGIGSCGFTTLRFNELPFQPVNGLQIRGVQFFFTVNGQPSNDAFYNALGPGIQTFVQDPVLEGDAAGVLRLDFPALTPTLSFGIARNTTAALTPGATVILFDAGGNPFATIPVNLAPTFPGGFAEALFNYGGPTLVSRAVILFNSPALAPRFAIDNLTYRAFDIVLQDDADPNEILQFNSITGHYQFINCLTGLVIEGRGGAVRFGCNITFGSGGGNKGGPATVSASVNTCTNQGSATVRPNGGATININDSNITDNTCCEQNGQGNNQVMGNKK